MKIEIEPVGIIRTPYKTVADGVPIQGARHPHTEGRVELYEPYHEGLLHLEGFSHVYLLYFFHWSQKTAIRACPYAEDVEHGIFAIRSPHRPNHIGMTLVRLAEVGEKSLVVKGVDMLDGTPLLDIKPYSPAFDAAVDVRTGWMEKAAGEKGFDIKVKDAETWLHENGGHGNGGKNE